MSGYIFYSLYIMDPIQGIFFRLTLRAIKSYFRVDQPVTKHLSA